ncbi:Dipeptidyl aminopeptidase/acylaminoacyl peptidase [Natronorubrum sediminis]|uniref:Dipeptidyl aminopeptidase/acylaminoacyl peptidase n=1 Tax=Natronorubrum sediminis TaxID=640943 RepID=A0A1H6FSG1_9EURY|nr:prolyl oligopeptidase family serine peptidase [Natronorubrum sediminis]SEH13088.1 Dipeptidyl aminopeptidase/acylaminoacyl peptidase [Natronorubrum sediminis]
MGTEPTDLLDDAAGTDSSRRRVLRTVGMATAAGLVGTGAGTGGSVGAEQQSCPGGDHLESPRPGPDVLDDDPVLPPQFESTDEWDADPLLVSGRTAYDGGEFLSQGWAFDDRGPEDEREYPDEDRYANNAADILEIRTRPTDDGVAYRIALNTMIEPDAAIVAIGIDTGGDGDTDWGHNLGDLGAPVDHVLAVWGTGATLDGEALPDDAFSVDVDRNHLEVEVDLEPGRETWRHYAVAGLHDRDGDFRQDDGFLDIGDDDPPVYNVGFRTVEDEPLEAEEDDRLGLDIDLLEGIASLLGGEDGWRSANQAEALSERDISDLGADVDFGRLEDGDVDREIPQTGYHNRLYGSRYDLGEGITLDDEMYRTRVQPYSVYVPESYEPGEPAPMHLLLHSLGQNYNQYAASPNKLAQLGAERDAIVLMPHGRGPSGWWANEAELDAFEAWADLTARYDIDVDRVTIGGYSMGGFGTYRLGSLYPDLFARGFAVVGPADEDILGGPTDDLIGDQNAMRVTDNLRHVPLLMWAGVLDELVPYAGVRNYRRQLADHGYRHRLDSFPADDHFTPFVRDEWGPGQAYLGDAVVERQPARVTYRVAPEFGNDEYDLEHDGVYWVHEIEVADDEDDGVIDAISLVDGYDEPEIEEFEEESTDPELNTREGIHWRDPLERHEPENAIELEAEDVTAATLYVDDVGVDTTEPLEIRVETSHKLTLTLESGAGNETLEFETGESSQSVELCDRGPNS